MIDIFIFTTNRSLEIALLQYRGLVEDSENNVSLVCPDDCVVPREVKVVRDSQVPMYEQIMSHLVHVEAKKGWYLQQLLKLSCCYNSVRDCLILDGDTLFSRRFIETLKNGQIGTTKENVAVYNEFFKKNRVTSLITSESFITNCMYFPSELRDCELMSVDDLGCILRTSESGLFSEYQYIGATRVECDLVSDIFKMRMFRRADLLNLRVSDLNRLMIKKNYDAICFEQNHNQSFVRKIVATIAFWVGYAW
jgi:hypothetical protein